jgi:hypothetical protein
MSEMLASCRSMAQAIRSMAQVAAGFADTLESVLGVDAHAVAGVAGIAAAYAEVADAWERADAQIRFVYEVVIEAVVTGGAAAPGRPLFDG